MRIDGKHYRSIALAENGWSVRIIDQRQLPWQVKFVQLSSLEDAATAIRDMWVRGAPLIGAVAAYGLCLALRKDASDAAMHAAYSTLYETRPTAINLEWALDQIEKAVLELPVEKRTAAAYARAAEICDEDVALCRSIGGHGLALIRAAASRHPGKKINILTHCNAGWLATVDYGTALAPIYLAHDAGMPIHVWVDETRPRNQGASLTAWELAQHGVPHTLIADNAGGLLMRKALVDMCIVGTDRVTRNGDVCNKIGTYLKALAAMDNSVPFYVALPYSTFDHSLATGDAIPIEERSATELTHITGRLPNNEIATVQLTASPAANPAFDVTPARLVTAFITDRGIYEPQDLTELAA